MNDGLSQLAQRRRRTREIPPPRHPARIGAVQLEPAPEPPAAAEQTMEEAPVVVGTAQSARKLTSRPAQTAQPKAKAKGDLKVVTIYLEEDDDTFLETITHTGRTSQPKTAISRSAVVRLALERLHTQMSPAEIVDELRPRGESLGTGRKRR